MAAFSCSLKPACRSHYLEEGKKKKRRLNPGAQIKSPEFSLSSQAVKKKKKSRFIRLYVSLFASDGTCTHLERREKGVKKAEEVAEMEEIHFNLLGC